MANSASLDRNPDSAHGPSHPHVGRPADSVPAIERSDAPRDEAFLIAFLPYAVAQAQRHREPVSLLFVAIDRLAAIRELHGPGLAETAVRHVVETVVKTLRASDLVARLDDGRIVVVLPYAGAPDLPTVAEAVRKAIDEAGGATCSMPRLTASIGMATYPDHAHGAGSLLRAAVAALDRARRLGPNRTAAPEPVA
ncbi:MAG TPA: GGDEF domain-containing protein [Isosphaeraceae bacterium]|nr:GGDEF domain-containing protein [Isosphaeraceae bacterium]